MPTLPKTLLRVLVVSAVLFTSSCSGGGDSKGIASDSDPRTAALTWSAVTTGNVSGYRVYFGTSSRIYDQPFGQGLNAGIKTSYSVTGLSSKTRYYFTVTAYDAITGFESGFSNEAFKDIP